MSACLFMVPFNSLTHKTVDEINELIAYWKTGLNPDPTNRFECDRAGGFRMNIQVAESELECRKAGTTNHSIQFRIEREVMEGSPNLKRALLDASAKGVGYVRCTDKHPDKWFEYVTEEQLKKDLK